MICRIAETLVEIPEAGGMAPRCQNYLTDEDSADIIIRADRYRLDIWPTDSYELICYLESGIQFYVNLMKFSGMMLHASAVELEGKAYLFSANCGVGKSTHTKIWKEIFAAKIFNDDKPALRRLEDRWYAYGTPWSGKNFINQNKKVPLAGICFLKQGSENSIRRISKAEAVSLVLPQTLYGFKTTKGLDRLLPIIDQLIREIPIYELINRPEPDAARLSYETMRRGAEEIGL